MKISPVGMTLGSESPPKRRPVFFCGLKTPRFPTYVYFKRFFGGEIHDVFEIGPPLAPPQPQDVHLNRG